MIIINSFKVGSSRALSESFFVYHEGETLVIVSVPSNENFNYRGNVGQSQVSRRRYDQFNGYGAHGCMEGGGRFSGQ